MSTPEGFGCNWGNTLIKVVHSELVRVGESAYRSLCPVCKNGHLMVTRNRNTLGIMRVDSCTFCCQGVIYQDDRIADEAVEPLPDEYIEKFYAARRVAPPWVVSAGLS